MSWFSKHITLVFLPQETSAVRRARLPLPIFILLLGLILGILSLWLWVVYDYFDLRRNLVFLEKNKQTYVDLQSRVTTFDRRYQEASLHQDHLKELHYRLRSLTSLQALTGGKLITDQEAMHQQQLTAKEKGILEVIAAEDMQVDQNIQLREKRIKNIIEFYAEKANPLSRYPSIWPVKGVLTTEFGMKFDSLTGQRKPHHGIVFATRSFSPVIAPADGIVEYAGHDEIYENLVVLDHGNGIKTRFGNLSAPEVQPGEIVRRGDLLAQIGNTGRTTGPQLYYEIILNGIPQHPVKFIPGVLSALDQ